MAIQDKKSILGNINDDVYGSVDLSVSLPKYEFPQTEQNPRHAYALVHDELMMDGNARQNLATFCQTWEEPEIHQLMDECIDKNMVDRDEYPRPQKLKRAAFTCCPICGTHRQGLMLWAHPPPGPARQPCWAAWR